MILHFNNKEFDLTPDDNSYRNRVTMGEHALTLTFALPEHVDIPIGAYTEYETEIYTLENPAVVIQQGERIFEYTLVMESEEYKTRKYKLRNPVDHRLKFTLTAKPKEFAQLIVDNLNMRDSGWTVGDCVEGVEITISFNHQYVGDALKTIVETIKTEYEFARKTLHFRKVEYNKADPLVLAYGCGNGFKKGLKRDNDTSEKAIEILYVQGGERNIDASKYGSGELLLPKGQTLEYEGRTYVADADGYSVRRADKELRTGEENSLDCSHIYPKREGEVGEVIVVNKDKNFYDFTDADIPEALDYNKYLIEGENMTVIFQSGMLAGKEFDVKYKHVGRRFEIVPQEIDGRTMPDDVYCPRKDDKYAVFNCMLPDAYICDNETKTGASWDMFREAAKHLREHEDPRFSFTGELNGIWAKKDWLNIGGKIVLGGYTKFTAPFVPEGVLIRIRAIKEFINNPHSPVLELSNVTSPASVSSELDKIGQNEVVAEENKKEAIQFAKRRFRDAEETTKMLESAFTNFSGSINPVTVNAMQILLGDKSLQFMFVRDKTSAVEVPHTVKFTKETKILTAGVGLLKHMTLGIDSLSSAHKPEEYKYWNISAFTSPVLTDPQAYYLYAKVPRSGTIGVFYLSVSPIGMESTPDYYYLFMGILNSEYSDDRSWTQFYGFSEWTPGQLLVNRVVSPDGDSYFDMQNRAMKLGDVFDYNSRGDGLLRMKGTIIQSASGDESVVGCWRGQYTVNELYYEGDGVFFLGSSYRCKKDCPRKAVLPTDTEYWKLAAQGGTNGTDGKDGTSGADGKPGPVPVYRGEWKADEQYYGNSDTIDIVYTGGRQYNYRAKQGVGTIPLGTPPTDTAYWVLMNYFENVATGLLLAENANIANFIFRSGVLTSQATTNGKYNIAMDGRDGAGHLAAGNLTWDVAGNIGLGGAVSEGFTRIEVPENRTFQIPNDTYNLIAVIRSSIYVNLLFPQNPKNGRVLNVYIEDRRQPDTLTGRIMTSNIYTGNDSVNFFHFNGNNYSSSGAGNIFGMLPYKLYKFQYIDGAWYAFSHSDYVHHAALVGYNTPESAYLLKNVGEYAVLGNVSDNIRQYIRLSRPECAGQRLTIKIDNQRSYHGNVRLLGYNILDFDADTDQMTLEKKYCLTLRTTPHDRGGSASLWWTIENLYKGGF